MSDEKCIIDVKLKQLFNQMSGCWGAKDLSSTFLYANQNYAKLVGVKEDKHLDIIGKTDFDMPCDTVI